MSHAKRKKTWILSMKYWLFQRDPYVMVVDYNPQSAGLAGVSSGMGLDDGLLVCTLLLLI